MVVWSFWSIEGRRIIRVFSLDNYWKLFQPNSIYLAVLIRTIGLSLLICGLSLLISYPVAFYVAKVVRSAQAKVKLLLIIILPFLLGFLVRTIAWRGILGINGLVNTALVQVGLVAEPLEFLLYGRFSVILALLYNYYPFMFFTLYIALEAVDDNIIAAAFDLAANRRQVLVHILLPLSMPGIVTGTVLTFVPVAAAVLEPEILGGPSGRFIGNSIQGQFTRAYNWPMGAALSVVLMIVLMVVLGLLIGVLAWRFKLVIRYDV
jgi:spermidine/putrescine transport system permease protein